MPDMKLQSLWYLRRQGRVSGPFPERWLRRDLLLGRLRPEDEISLDRLAWIPLGQRTDWLGAESARPPTDLPEWQEERRRARLRWLDERRLPDRRTRQPRPFPDAGEKRSRRERRAPERAELKLLRQRHAELEQELAARRERFLGMGLLLVLLAALVIWAAARFAPVRPIEVHLGRATSDCRAPAGPQVNWAGCDRNGAWLRGVDLSSAMLAGAHLNSANLSLARLAYANLGGADLSYANLEGATLQAASLQGANLAYASLKHADLTRADLRGARLEAVDLTDARLGLALWSDGRICLPESVGVCLP
ncbi:pentapeptide repeat-containing protein [Thiobacter aerophilum]|uniref:Pentapeptide repeat-containing protein n=1 Tax=Thiobacter aerophilum TaxID=3121275 RepID=A0ABV0EAK2_9BURK